MDSICKAPGCNRPVVLNRHHLCHTHYVRYRRNGTVGFKPITPHKKIKPYIPSEDHEASGGLP